MDNRARSLREIAQRLNVSKTTVSLALRNSARISEARRREVRELAKELGYQQDAVYSALAANKWKSLPPEVRSGIAILYLGTREFPREMATALEKQAHTLGYGIDALWLRDFPSQQKAFSVIRARGVRGVLLSQAETPDFALDADVSDLALLATPVGSRALPVNTVADNPFRATRLALRELRRRGYRRPGLVITYSPRSLNEDHAVGAYFAEWDKGAFPGTMPQILQLPLGNTEALQKWIQTQGPDVILSIPGNREKELRDLGYRMPEDIGYLALYRNKQKTKATGMDYGLEERGRQSVILLHSMIQSQEFGFPQRNVIHLIEPKWVEGNTIRPAEERGVRSAGG